MCYKNRLKNTSLPQFILWCCFQQDDLVRAVVPGMAISEVAARVSYLASWQRNEAVSDSHSGLSRCQGCLLIRHLTTFIFSTTMCHPTLHAVCSRYLIPYMAGFWARQARSEPLYKWPGCGIHFLWYSSVVFSAANSIISSLYKYVWHLTLFLTSLLCPDALNVRVCVCVVIVSSSSDYKMLTL